MLEHNNIQEMYSIDPSIVGGEINITQHHSFIVSSSIVCDQDTEFFQIC